MQAIYSTLIKELHQFAKTHQFERAVVGLSGGLDSAVTLCIAVRAFGPKNVTALIMPEMNVTPPVDIEHAKILADHFGCNSHYQPINNFLVDFNFVGWEVTDAAHENLKARLRSVLLRHFAESKNAVFLGTANKSDFILGYGTPEGELDGDIHVIGDLHKTEVMELARFIGLPDELLVKEPSRRLTPRQTDDIDLSGSWPQVDEILRQLHSGVDPETMIQKGMDPLMVHKIVRMVQQNESALKDAPVIPVAELSASIKKAWAAEASSLS